MRKIPVTKSGDHSKIIGWLHLDDTISDAEVSNTYVSWGVNIRDNKLIEMALIPKLRLKIENNPPGLFKQEREGNWKEIPTEGRE